MTIPISSPHPPPPEDSQKLTYESLLETAISVACEAGKLLLAKPHSKVRISATRDTKLDADIESETVILKHLRTSYPVMSEEAGGKLSENGPTWIVDPLDGTVNYERGIPLSCISICLWHNGPVLGVVYDFNRGEIFSGIVGRGAKLNGKEIKVSQIENRADSIIFTGFPIATSFETDSLHSFIKLVQRYKKVRLLGSAALSLAYVACGRGDVYIEQKIRIWDVAAGLAILNAAGGAFQMLGEEPLDVYADNGVLIGVDN